MSLKIGNVRVNTKALKEKLKNQDVVGCQNEMKYLLRCAAEAGNASAAECIGAYTRLALCLQKAKIQQNVITQANKNIGFHFNSFAQQMAAYNRGYKSKPTKN